MTFYHQPVFPNADLLGYSADKKLWLVVELKHVPVGGGASRLAGNWLQQFGEQEPNMFGLFVTPSWMLLRCPIGQRRSIPQFIGPWSRGIKEQLIAGPYGREIDYAVVSNTPLDVAIDTKRVPLYKLSLEGLHQVVSTWLFNAIFSSSEQLLAENSNAWLVDSGLHALLYQGDIIEARPATSGYASFR